MNNRFLETIKSIDGKPFHIPYHQWRYEKVLNSLGIIDPPNLEDYIAPPNDGLYRCRVVYTKDSIDVNYFKYNKRHIKTLKLIESNSIEYSFKYEDRKELDLLYNKRESCDDILIVKNSYITDTSIANVALYKNGEWVTPKSPLLKGTTRQRLLDEGKIIEKDILVDDVFSYTKIALLNAMIDFDIIRHENIREIVC